MGIGPFTHGSAVHTDVMKTQALKQALDKYGFDAAFGGARRDEEKSRAKERVFSIRSAQHRWDPKQQRPELWRLYNTRTAQGRKHPRLSAVELDRARRLAVHLPREHPDRAAVLRQAAAGRAARRHLIMVDDDRMPLEPGEQPEMQHGALPHAGLLSADRGDRERRRHAAGRSFEEMLLTTTSERQGRVIDHDQSASMEKKKQEGYF